MDRRQFLKFLSAGPLAAFASQIAASPIFATKQDMLDGLTTSVDTFYEDMYLALANDDGELTEFGRKKVIMTNGESEQISFPEVTRSVTVTHGLVFSPMFDEPIRLNFNRHVYFLQAQDTLHVASGMQFNLV